MQAGDGNGILVQPRFPGLRHDTKRGQGEMSDVVDSEPVRYPRTVRPSVRAAAAGFGATTAELSQKIIAPFRVPREEDRPGSCREISATGQGRPRGMLVSSLAERFPFESNPRAPPASQECGPSDEPSSSERWKPQCFRFRRSRPARFHEPAPRVAPGGPSGRTARQSSFGYRTSGGTSVQVGAARCSGSAATPGGPRLGRATQRMSGKQSSLKTIDGVDHERLGPRTMIQKSLEPFPTQFQHSEILHARAPPWRKSIVRKVLRDKATSHARPIPA